MPNVYKKNFLALSQFNSQRVWPRTIFGSSLFLPPTAHWTYNSYPSPKVARAIFCEVTYNITTHNLQLSALLTTSDTERKKRKND